MAKRAARVLLVVVRIGRTFKAHRDGGGRIVVSCRQCAAQDELRAAVDRLLGDEPTDPARWARRGWDASSGWVRAAPSTREDDEAAEKIAAARELWTAGGPADGTPARRYLVTRRAWPPEEDRFPDLPKTVRWIPADRWKSSKWAGWLPKAAAGAICCAFRCSSVETNNDGLDDLAPYGPGDTAIMAVFVEALDAAGRCVPYVDSEGRRFLRWRRSPGVKTGARFEATERAGRRGGGRRGGDRRSSGVAGGPRREGCSSERRNVRIRGPGARGSGTARPGDPGSR